MSVAQRFSCAAESCRVPFPQCLEVAPRSPARPPSKEAPPKEFERPVWPEEARNAGKASDSDGGDDLLMYPCSVDMVAPYDARVGAYRSIGRYEGLEYREDAFATYAPVDPI
eukprot:CAMPEP_0180117740 /NCGR_PEP_ID=MMETSP0986-20121125/1083_1 /TAXON_ID=697907 /ORGANISM="non described non described, Strain CCMP2293" /LENGTH=111 /DNA_ID=CAMNT_0022056641 /DNA_START=39 /DNA_END=374 /DNA_ORIENTATION=-